MIILNTTTKTIEVLLAGAVATNELAIVAAYVDIATAGHAVALVASNDDETNGVTPVTAVAAPAASATRQIKTLFVHNTDTAAATVTVQLNNNTTIRPLVTLDLDPGETLQYVDGVGWTVIETPFVGQQLAQARENSTAAVSVYAPTKPTKITSITICNQTANPETFSLFLDAAGSTYDESTALRFDAAIAANDSVVIGNVFYMDAGNLAYASSTANALTITVHGEVKG